MPRTIYLARHGETDWNRERRWQGHADVVLNESGKSQARELAEALRTSGLCRAYSSDLSRARETAEIVADALGLGPVSVDPGLRERSFGVFEGLTEIECRERYPEHWAGYASDLRRPPPGAEPFERVAERIRAAVDRILDEKLDQPGAILLVSHGGAIRSFVLAATGTLPPPLNNGATFRITSHSNTLLEIERIR